MQTNRIGHHEHHGPCDERGRGGECQGNCHLSHIDLSFKNKRTPGTRIVVFCRYLEENNEFPFELHFKDCRQLLLTVAPPPQYNGTFIPFKAPPL